MMPYDVNKTVALACPLVPTCGFFGLVYSYCLGGHRHPDYNAAHFLSDVNVRRPGGDDGDRSFSNYDEKAGVPLERIVSAGPDSPHRVTYGILQGLLPACLKPRPVESWKRIAGNLFLLTAGNIIYAAGINSIIIPQHFLSGGVMGVALVAHYLIPAINAGYAYFLLNIPLFCSDGSASAEGLFFTPPTAR